MMTPVVEILESTSLKSSAWVPSAKSRFPLPMVMGYIHTCIRSMRWCLSNVCMRFPLPHTHRSGAFPSFSFFICGATSPVTQNELCHEGSNNSCDTTYFFVLLNGSAIAPVCLDQY